ncbi:alpha/beta hydrolase fold domain-containing protein [Erysipelotrichaceae bacterium OttesenSCG-928-M19]|nr:alpha/beta hydrolase fold domain-containing protein [Erysipelotrichaceae bacterium OttesenSCG-928-M19]
MKNLKRIFIIFVLLFFFVSFNSSIESKPKTNNYITKKNKYNLKYNTLSAKQKLSIYYPKKIKKNRNNPVVLFLHGGYYQGGNKNTGLKKNRQYFNEAGYVYVTMNYRLMKQGSFPAAANDVKTAIRYLKYHSKKLAINPNKIIIIGHSAGANLGALVSSTPKIKSFDNEKIRYRKANNKVAGFIGIGGFYNLNSYFEINKITKKEIVTIDDNDNTTVTIKYIWPPFSKRQANLLPYYNLVNKQPDQKKFNKANPTKYISSLKARVYLIHGSKDTTVSYKQMKEYCKLLKKNKKRVKCNIYKGKKHKYRYYTNKNSYNKMIKWMNKTVKHK